MLPYSASVSSFQKYFHDCAKDQSYLIIEGGGAIVRETIDRATYEMLKGLMHVVQRIDQCAPVRYLTELETASVLGGASSYRSPDVTRDVPRDAMRDATSDATTDAMDRRNSSSRHELNDRKLTR